MPFLKFAVLAAGGLLTGGLHTPESQARYKQKYLAKCVRKTKKESCDQYVATRWRLNTTTPDLEPWWKPYCQCGSIIGDQGSTVQTRRQANLGPFHIFCPRPLPRKPRATETAGPQARVQNQNFDGENSIFGPSKKRSLGRHFARRAGRLKL